MSKSENASTLTQLDGTRLRIGIVQSQFNSHITDALAQACISELINLQVPEKKIQLLHVPARLEPDYSPTPELTWSLKVTVETGCMDSLGAIIYVQ